MSAVEAVGFAALTLNIVGNWMLTSKRPGGWWVRIACNVAQLAYALCISSPSLGASAVIFGGINAIGIVRWRRADGHSRHCRIEPCNCGRLA